MAQRLLSWGRLVVMPQQWPCLSPALAGQCVGSAQGATLSLRLTLVRLEGEEKQGGAGQDCKGGGGEVERPVGNLTVLAWRGAAAGRARRADGEGCGTFLGWLEQGVGSGTALGAWGRHRAVPGLHRAWSDVGTALLHLPPWRGSSVSQARRQGRCRAVIPAGLLPCLRSAPTAPGQPSELRSHLGSPAAAAAAGP